VPFDGSENSHGRERNIYMNFEYAMLVSIASMNLFMGLSDFFFYKKTFWEFVWILGCGPLWVGTLWLSPYMYRLPEIYGLFEMKWLLGFLYIFQILIMVYRTFSKHEFKNF
jgi:hypothetical protein